MLYLECDPFLHSFLCTSEFAQMMHPFISLELVEYPDPPVIFCLMRLTYVSIRPSMFRAFMLCDLCACPIASLYEHRVLHHWLAAAQNLTSVGLHRSFDLRPVAVIFRLTV